MRPGVLRFAARLQVNNRKCSTRVGEVYELYSKLRVSPLIFPTVVPNLIPYITPLRRVDYSSYDCGALGSVGFRI